MKKIISSLLAIMIIFSGVVNASATTQAQPRGSADVFEETIKKQVNVYSSSGSKIGTVSTSCTAKIRRINGSYTIDSYSTSLPKQKIGSTVVTGTVSSKSVSGAKITITWKVKAEFASIPPKIVYTNQSVTYDFS